LKLNHKWFDLLTASLQQDRLFLYIATSLFSNAIKIIKFRDQAHLVTKQRKKKCHRSELSSLASEEQCSIQLLVTSSHKIALTGL